MRILYLYRYGILGGVVTQLRNRWAYLRTRKVHVDLGVIQDHGAQAALDGIGYHVLPDAAARRALLQRGKYDVVAVIDTPEVYPDLAAAGCTCAVLNEVHTTTTNLSYLEKLRARPPMQALLAPSRYLQSRVLDEFGFRGVRPVHVVPNCVDTRMFAPQKVDVRYDRRIVAWVGKLHEHKNWEGFLEMAAALGRDRDDLAFWMVGGETAPDAVARGFLSRVAELGLLSRLRWIARAEYDDMPRLYSVVAQSGGALVSTSIDESFGMTVAEALSCGCPVAAARVGALPELLEGELARGLFESNDLEGGVRAVSGLLEHAASDPAYGRAALGRVRTSFTIEAVGASYLQLLQALVKERRALKTGA